MTAFYNEIDPYAAAWLRNLIAAGHIAPGVVDERDIRDILPSELAGYTQCHFFAGVGVWSHALRLAGWPDDRPVWSGSCPCQPFSAAGAGLGFADERHLWPAWHHLIRERRPPVVFGEQVASKDVDPWIDLVQDDMEALGYAVGAVPFPSAGVGAPHIRDRCYFVAHSNAPGQRALDSQRREPQRSEGQADHACASGGPRLLADSERFGLRGGGPEAARGTPAGVQGAHGQRERLRIDAGSGDAPVAIELAHDDDAGQRPEPGLRLQRPDLHDADGRGPLGGFWAGADWIACRDGKWRPVEPGTFPLAHGAPARVGRLRAYGNAINAQAAAVFIESVMA